MEILTIKGNADHAITFWEIGNLNAREILEGVVMSLRGKRHEDKATSDKIWGNIGEIKDRIHTWSSIKGSRIRMTSTWILERLNTV